jgi:hypothetical protein
MLEQQLKALFDLYGEEFIKDMRAKMASDKRVASGSASVSLESVSTVSGFSILGNDYIEQISEGRKPGPISEEGFKRIKDWVRIKGITPNKPNIRYKDLPFLVARSVRTRGFAATGLFDYVINKNIVQLSEDVADVVLEVVGEQIDQTIRANFKGRNIGTAI